MSRPSKAVLTALLLIVVSTAFLLGDNRTTTRSAKAADNAMKDQLRQLLLERKQLLEKMADSHKKFLEMGRSSTSAYMKTQRAALLAGLDLCNTKAERIKIRMEVVELYKETETWMKRRTENGHAPQGELDEVRVARLEAEIKLLKEQLKG